MKLVSVDCGSGPEGAVVIDDQLAPLQACLERAGAKAAGIRTVSDLVKAGAAFQAVAWAHAAGRLADLAAASLKGARPLAPIPRPGKIIGVGRNYAAHAAELGTAQQEYPRLFMKLPGTVIGPTDPIRRPPGIVKLDWEVEIAVVVGSTMRKVAAEDVDDHIAGYMIANDVTAREFQFDVTPAQTSFAKSMDGFAPTGPMLVTSESFDARDARLRTWLNGEVVQDGSTRDMIFSVPTLLSHISRYITLEPCDVVLTGTPAGSGHFRKPPRYLVPGDVLETEVGVLGRQVNRVTD